MPDNDNQWLARVPELDRGRRFPSLDPKEATKLFDELLAAGDEAIVGVIDTLRDVDDGTDWKTRFVLHAVASHTGEPGREKERRKLERIYAHELNGERSAGVKTFLAMQLQWIAGSKSAPMLAAELGSGDAQLVAAAGASLAAIGKGAIPALKAASEEAEGAARTAIDHALLQIERRSRG